MKKILLALMAVVLCFALTACGNTVDFDGKFKEEATEEQVNETLKAISSAELDETALEGMYVKLEGTVKIPAPLTGTSQKVEYDLIVKAKLEEGKIKMAGEGSVKAAGKKATYKIYYVDGTMYMDTKVDGEHIKIKTDIGTDFEVSDSLDKIIGDDLDFSEQLKLLENSYAELQAEGIKVYIDKDEDNVKIKMFVTDEQIGDSEIYFVVESGKVKGMKVTVKDDSMDINYEYGEYTGSVKVPSSFDGYEEYGF